MSPSTPAQRAARHRAAMASTLARAVYRANVDLACFAARRGDVSTMLDRWAKAVANDRVRAQWDDRLRAIDDGYAYLELPAASA